MRRRLTLLIGLLLFSGIFIPAAFGQVELSGAYSFLRTGPGPGENLNGWDASVSTHLIGDLGLEADYSDQYGQNVRPRFTELYGPRFELLDFPRVEPYVHALFGTVQENEGQPLCITAPFSGCGSSNQTSFGMAFGGGLEVKFTRHIWIRPFQLDYIRYKSFNNNWNYSGRFSAGLVFRFGRW